MTGNTISVKSPAAVATDAANTAGLATVYAYTADNLIAASTPISNARVSGSACTFCWRKTSYGYDPEGDKVTAATGTASGNTDPTQAGTFASGGVQAFDYYPDGRLKTQHGRLDGSNAETITATYDAGGALTGSVDAQPAHGSGAASVSAYTSTVTASHYLDGMLRSVDDGQRLTTASYDGAGALSARSTGPNSGSGSTITTVVTNNDADLPQTMTEHASPDRSWQFAYDVGGRAVEQDNPNSTKQVFHYTAGQDTLADTSVATNGGLTLGTDTYSYDEMFRVTGQTFSGTTSTGANIAAVSYGYAYWPSGAVKRYSRGATNRSFSYDHDTNRLTATDPNGTAHTFTYRADDDQHRANPQ